MSLMPYAMDKGPYLSIMEDFVNGDRGPGPRPRGCP